MYSYASIDRIASEVQNMGLSLVRAPAQITTFTGHNLGSTLTPALFAMLKSNLSGVNCISCSFAGLTSDDKNFGVCINGFIPADSNWRNCNPFDVTPSFFRSQSS